MKKNPVKIHVIETPEDYTNLLEQIIKEKEEEEAAKSELRKWGEALARPFQIAFYIMLGGFAIILFSIAMAFEKKQFPMGGLHAVDPEIKNLYDLDSQN